MFVKGQHFYGLAQLSVHLQILASCDQEESEASIKLSENAQGQPVRVRDRAKYDPRASFSRCKQGCFPVSSPIFVRLRITESKKHLPSLHDLQCATYLRLVYRVTQHFLLARGRCFAAGIHECHQRRADCSVPSAEGRAISR